VISMTPSMKRKMAKMEPSGMRTPSQRVDQRLRGVRLSSTWGVAVSFLGKLMVAMCLVLFGI
jgi:hypothetical protein